MADNQSKIDMLMKYKGDMERDKAILGEQMVEKIQIIQVLESKNRKLEGMAEESKEKVRRLEDQFYKMKYEKQTQVYPHDLPGLLSNQSV